MHLHFLLALQAVAASTAAAVSQTAPGQSYSGRAGQLEVSLPRIDAKVTVDGRLDEPVWGEASILQDFSQFLPNDGVAAADSTEVLVWYAPDAIYFGVRAREPHGAVHATLADRDRIRADDFIEILIGTFNDGRQATMFGVNPLGVQMDGALVERDCPTAQWAVRPLSDADFARITALGLRDDELLPRVGEVMAGDRVHDLQAPYEVERTIILDDVLFDFDRTNVKPEAAAILDRLVAFMNENKDKKAALSGHTDNVGTEAYNQKLSERRVNSVRDYVVKKGVDSGSISGQGFGESKPIADNKTKEGRAKNRRVEIKVN